MLLHITFKELYPFTIYSTDLEQNIDVLSRFVANGREVEEAVLIDVDGSRTVLPLEAFDGEPIGSYMLNLEWNYYEILESSAWATKWDKEQINAMVAKTNETIQSIETLKTQKALFRKKASEILSRLDELQEKIQNLKK